MRKLSLPLLFGVLVLSFVAYPIGCSRPCNPKGHIGGGCGPTGTQVPGFRPFQSFWGLGDDDIIWEDDDMTAGTGSPWLRPSPSPPSNALQTCTLLGTHTLPLTGTLRCADSTGTMDWDWYSVPVQAGDCVDIYTDNEETGSADLLALAIDPNGSSRYGLAPDYSQLDDEWACSSQTWDGYGCPAASAIAETTGTLQLLIAQWGGGGSTPGVDACVDLSGYTLWVAVNGVDLLPTLIADDTPLE